MIAGVSKEQLANHCAGKGDRVDILLGGRVSVLGAVKAAEDGVDLADDSGRGVTLVSRCVKRKEVDHLPIQIAIREQARAASNCWPTALPSAFLMILKWSTVHSGLIPFRRGVDLLCSSREQPHSFGQ